MKFGRKYRITIQTTDTNVSDVGPTLSGAQAIIIELPLTVQFDIHRSISSSLNQMILKIYNLSATHRNQIFQDRFSTQRHVIIVEAGYESDTLSTIFIGDIYQANSAREGTNIVTTIDARDGNFDTDQTVIKPQTFAAGSTAEDIVKYLAGQFPNIKTGKIFLASPLTQNAKYIRPVVLEGNVYQQIKKYADMRSNNVFIDLNVINVAGQDTVIVNDNLALIDASTGLINTPRRDQSFLVVETLFEPRVIMSQVVQLKSTVMPQYNGAYKVVSVNHRGTISATVSGPLSTTFSMVGNQTIGGPVTI